MERTCCYAGPEEGGTWVHDSIVAAWKEFESLELAQAAMAEVDKLAIELAEYERRSYGEHCLRTMEWLDARGLDADYLPEPDGPSEFYVQLCTELPQSHYASRVYE